MQKMKSYKYRLFAVVFSAIFVLLAFVACSDGADDQSADSDQSWDEYKVILERNMFSRDRGRVEAVARRESSAKPKTIAPAEQSYFVLRGIVQQDGVFAAFFEDKRYGDITRVWIGQSIAGGVVQSLGLDSIDFELGEQKVTVHIGENLQGRPGSSIVTYDDILDWTQTVPSGSEHRIEPELQGEEAEILKQLIERRRKELGG